MVLQRRWEDAWQEHLLTPHTQTHHSQQTIDLATPTPDALLMEDVLFAARLFKQKQEAYLRLSAIAAQEKVPPNQLDNAKKQISQARRLLFATLLKLDANEYTQEKMFSSQAPR